MEYKETVNFWLEKYNQVLTKTSMKQDWMPWLEQYYNDGTPMEDGNPIFMSVNKTANRSVKIIQNEPDRLPVYEYYALMDRTGYGLEDCSEFMDEMVFIYNPYEERFPEISARHFCDLFSIWSNPKTSYEEMETIIESYMGKENDS
jgi:hypothetical protein